MAKIIFMLQRKSGTTREECLDYWAGERHTSIVRRLPGLTRWVQNHVVSARLTQQRATESASSRSRATR